MEKLTILVLCISSRASGDYFPLREGHVWNSVAKVVQGDKKSEVEALARVTGKKKIGETECFAIEVQVGGVVSREYVAADAEGIKVFGSGRGGADYVYDAPLMRLKYPLATDASWEGKAGRGGLAVATKSRVVGEEEVEVPAGAYRAFKVRIEMESPAGKTESYTWFARDVGVVKQWVRQSSPLSQLELTIELKGFEKGK